MLSICIYPFLIIKSESDINISPEVLSAFTNLLISHISKNLAAFIARELIHKFLRSEFNRFGMFRQTRKKNDNKPGGCETFSPKE